MYKLKFAAGSLIGLSLLAVSSFASAESYGLLNGRSADVSRAPDTSVEAGAVFGEFDDVDYEYFGARFNYKYSPTAVLYGDIGQAELGSGRTSADGLTYGIGGFWQMDGILTDTDFGVHASFHLIDLDVDNSNASIEGNSITVEAVFSGQEPINQAGTMFLYGNIGLNRASSKTKNSAASSSTETDTELTFGGGIVVQTQSQGGEFYAGAFYLDDLGFGAGYRHFLR